MRRRVAALASDPVVEQAAQDLLLGGGSAVAAVLAGFFAAVGAYAGVLLGPLCILTGGVGQGARAFDGRVRQPGLGSRRPRRFAPNASIPPAARVGVPCAGTAALVAYAYHRGPGLPIVLRAGIQQAERSGASARAELLRRIRTVGAAAFTEPGFVRPLLKAAGPVEGGMLTASDFEVVPQLDGPAATRPLRGGVLSEPPWADQVERATEPMSLGVGGAVCAVDAHGTLAALCYRRAIDGLTIEELELEAPLVAVPVRRGIPRVRPGQPLPAPVPIALWWGRGEAPVSEVLAAPSALRLTEDQFDCCLRIRERTHEVELLRGPKPSAASTASGQQ